MSWALFNPCSPCCEEACGDKCLGGSADDFELDRANYTSRNATFRREIDPSSVLGIAHNTKLYLDKLQSGQYYRPVKLVTQETARRLVITAHVKPNMIDNTDLEIDSKCGIFIGGVVSMFVKYHYTPRTTEVFTSSRTWFSPPGVSIDFECWGGGADGETRLDRAGDGGGGGGYAKKSYSVTLPTAFQIVVGDVHSGLDSTVTNSQDGLIARGANAVGRLGGSGNIGDVTFNGGNGGVGFSGGAFTPAGGGGGASSAGPNGTGVNGGDGTATTGGLAGTGLSDTGHGGDGSDALPLGGVIPAASPGGGGGGNSPFQSVGTGGRRGQVRVSYDLPSVTFEGIDIYKDVDEFGEGGALNAGNIVSLGNINSSPQVEILLKIVITYSGIDDNPNLFTVYCMANGERMVFPYISRNVLTTPINMGVIAEEGGCWDDLCLVSNNQSSKCYPCANCDLKPTGNFPLRYLLSVPPVTNDYCNNCTGLSGDWILEYCPGAPPRAFGPIEQPCCWVSIPNIDGNNNNPLVNPCPNRNGSTEGFAWVLTAFANGASLRAISEGMPLVDSLDNRGSVLQYNVNNWNCLTANTLTRGDNISIFLQPFNVKPCLGPATLTVTPIFE